MATQSRHPALGLIDLARTQPYQFGFFQLVRLLRLHYSRSGRVDPQTRPHEEPLRFRSLLSLAFPASEVSNLRFETAAPVSADGQPLTEVQVTFMGLVGSSGVLPLPYTELLINRHVEQRDDAAHAFFDLFSHRMTALFYQAWQKYKFHIEFERQGHSDFQRYLLNWVGFGAQARKHLCAEGTSSLREDFFTYFSGLLSHRPHNALNLEQILTFYFRLPVRVHAFAGCWLRLDAQEQTRLGRSNALLCSSAVLGSRVWDYQSSLRITLGPLGLADYRRFLPRATEHRKLLEIVRFYLGAQFDFEIELRLHPQEVPPTRLQRSGGTALGWTGWLRCPERQGAACSGVLLRIPYDGVSL